ncbi:MAG: hypothetical protein VW576_05320 [Opitutae bacterium]
MVFFTFVAPFLVVLAGGFPFVAGLFFILLWGADDLAGVFKAVDFVGPDFTELFFAGEIFTMVLTAFFTEPFCGAAAFAFGLAFVDGFLAGLGVGIT